MTDYETIIEKIKEAEAILIGASNGFSIAEGLHIFGDNEDFRRLFGDFREKYGIRKTADTGAGSRSQKPVD